MDLPAREAIENALRSFDGTILIVTHDRYLLDAVTSRVIEFSDAPAPVQKVEKVAKSKPQKDSSQQKKSAPPEKTLQQVEKLEAQIKMAEMELKLIEHEINNETSPEKLSELAAAHENKLAEIDALYAAWAD